MFQVETGTTSQHKDACSQGVGKDYAKFCSVGTFDLASQLFKLSLTFCLATVLYCLLPHQDLKTTNHLTQILRSPGVIKLILKHKSM